MSKSLIVTHTGLKLHRYYFSLSIPSIWIHTESIFLSWLLHLHLFRVFVYTVHAINEITFRIWRKTYNHNCIISYQKYSVYFFGLFQQTVRYLCIDRSYIIFKWGLMIEGIQGYFWGIIHFYYCCVNMSGIRYKVTRVSGKGSGKIINS